MVTFRTAVVVGMGLFLVGGLLGLQGCSNMSARERDTAVGAGVGAVGGAVLTGGGALGTLGGAAIGGVLGNEVGKDERRR
jgi:osmotically inducible lipoprotein OsmB